MRRQTGFIACLLLIVGCTFNNEGITITWPTITRPVNPPVVDPVKPVEPKITTHEFRCLIIEDVEARAKLPASQLSMLTGKNVRDFCKANCAKDAEGNPQFRIVDKSAALTGIWSEMASKSTVATFPKLILQNGTGYLSKPLPTDYAELQSDLEQYAGVTP